MFSPPVGPFRSPVLARRAVLGGLAVTALGVWSKPARALPLAGTIWEKVGLESDCDPHLLYAVALIESSAGKRPGWVAPHPLAVRAPQRPYYPADLGEAQRLLKSLANSQKLSHSAIGMMQIFVRWHRRRVDAIEDLLDPWKNVRIGAEILSEAMRSSPQDQVLGIGRYHTWRQETVARQYGASVVALWRTLRTLS